jgi:hypothetical protein
VTRATGTSLRSYARIVKPHWDAAGVWGLLVVGCTVGILGAMRARFDVAWRSRLRQAPLLFIATGIDAFLTGLGAGMAVVFVILVLARVIHALGM